jgi:signal transduction histidine kinase/CheY-like chemotaxis protein
VSDLPRKPSDSAFLAEQVNQVYGIEPVGMAATAVNATILAYVQWNAISRPILIGWLIAIFSVTAFRSWINFRFRRAPVKPQEAVRWGRIFRAELLLAGLAWGAAGILLFFGVDSAHQIFTAFVLGGMVAGAAALYSPLKTAFSFFALPILIPIFLGSALQGGIIHHSMAMMMLVFGISMWFTSKRVQSTTWTSIRLRFENRDLVGTLSRAVEETQATNENLEAEVAVRRKTEEELQKHRDLLEAKVAARTEELNQTNQDLRDALEAKTRIEEERRSLEEQLQFARKMEALSTFAGGVAHDFNNLLMGIGGQLAIMMAARAPGDPDLERLTAMEKRVREGADLSRQLLGITLGGKYEARPTDLNFLVEKIGNFARAHKEFSVQTKLADRLWTVAADMAQIEHAIMNVCLNAMQAMPNGGKLTLQTRNVFVDASRAQSFDVKAGEFAVVEITDTGLGMEKSLLARIFDPFFTTKGMGHGTGLGLSSAYGIARNHGGFIEVQSEKGKGSTFSVFLPRTLALVEKEDLHGAGVPVAGGKSVLLVDDDSMVAEVGALMLEELGYRVHVALGGEAALELFKKHRHDIHLVLLDMIMPGLSGGETFRLLKEIDPSVRVLLTSGFSIEGEAQELINEGCLGFLNKPYNLASLGAKIEKALSQPVPS